MLRRSLIGRVGVLGLGVVGAACAPSGGGGTGTSGASDAAKPAPAGPQKVDVWWSIADSNPSIAPAWEDFLKRRPGWTGELQMGVTFDKFQASMAGGVLPDAYFGSFQQIQAGAYKKMYGPLDGYISRDK